MGGEHTPDCILVDVESKRLVDLLSDPRATEKGIPSLQFNDGPDEFTRQILGAQLFPPARRIQPSILLLFQQVMKFEQR